MRVLVIPEDFRKDQYMLKPIVEAVLGVPLEVNDQALATLTAWFARLKRPMAESNKIQAVFPRGTTPIDPRKGPRPPINPAA